MSFTYAVVGVGLLSARALRGDTITLSPSGAIVLLMVFQFEMNV